MRDYLKSCLIGAGVLAVSASPAIAAHHGKMKAEVKAFMDAATDAFVACEYEKSASMSAAGRTGYYPDSLDPQAEDSEEALASAKDFCDGGGKHELRIDARNIIMLNDAAVVHGKGHYKRTEPDGSVSLDTDYSYTNVLVKTDDGWKFRHGHIGIAFPMGDEAAE